MRGRLVGCVVGVVTVGFIGGRNGFPVPLFGRRHGTEFGGAVGGGVVIAVGGTRDTAVEDQTRILFAEGGEDFEVQFLRILVRRVAPQDGGPVVTDELKQLRQRFAVDAGLAALGAVRFGKPRIAGERPVDGMGIIDTQLYSVFVARDFEFAQRIATEFARPDHIVVVHLRIEHRHAIVVHRRDDDVSHACVLRSSHPLVGIEGRRVEGLHHFLEVGLAFDFGDALDVLGVALDFLAFPFSRQRGVDAPMDEHPEAGLPPPSESPVFGQLGCGRFRRGVQRLHNEQEDEERKKNGSHDQCNESNDIGLSCLQLGKHRLGHFAGSIGPGVDAVGNHGGLVDQNAVEIDKSERMAEC